MSKKIYILFFVGLFSIFTVKAKDGNYENINEIPLELCKLKTIVGNQYLISLKNQLKYSAYQKKLNDETLKIISEAKNKNKSVGEQLSPEKLIEFENNRQKKITINLQQLIESNRERDLDQIYNLFEVADKVYRYGEIYDKKDSAYDNYLKILVLRNQYNKTSNKITNQEDEFSDKTCSVDYAITKISEEPLRVINSINQIELENTLKNLTLKYNIRRIDRQVLSNSDKLFFDKLEAEKIQPLLNSTEYLIDLQNLKLLNKVSELVYTKLKEDLELSGGDSRQYGERLKVIFSDKNVDPRLSYSYAMLQIIEKSNPSQIAKQAKETVKFIESLK